MSAVRTTKAALTALKANGLRSVLMALGVVIGAATIVAEPTGNLDSHTGREILDLIDELHEQGRTVVLVTHDAEVAERADRIVRLKDGAIDLALYPA